VTFAPAARLSRVTIRRIRVSGTRRIPYGLRHSSPTVPVASGRRTVASRFASGIRSPLPAILISEQLVAESRTRYGGFKNPIARYLIRGETSIYLSLSLARIPCRRRFGSNGQFSALIVRFVPSRRRRVRRFLIARLPSKKLSEETTFPAEAGNFPARPDEKVSVGAVELSASFQELPSLCL